MESSNDDDKAFFTHAANDSEGLINNPYMNFKQSRNKYGHDSDTEEKDNDEHSDRSKYHSQSNLVNCETSDLTRSIYDTVDRHGEHMSASDEKMFDSNEEVKSCLSNYSSIRDSIEEDKSDSGSSEIAQKLSKDSKIDSDEEARNFLNIRPKRRRKRSKSRSLNSDKSKRKKFTLPIFTSVIIEKDEIETKNDIDKIKQIKETAKAKSKVSFADQAILTTSNTNSNIINISKDPRFFSTDFRRSLVESVQYKHNFKGLDVFDNLGKIGGIKDKMNIILDLDSTILHAYQDDGTYNMLELNRLVKQGKAFEI